MKKIKSIALVILISCICQDTFAQAFLKNYTDPSNPNAPVSFECITEKTDSSGNLYIGGHIGDTITLFKMSTAGTVLATYKIKTSPPNTKLDAIMLVLDAPTNTEKIVVLGNIQAGNGNQGIMFRFNKIYGTVDWFRQTNPAEQIAYWDMTDRTGPNYIVSGAKRADGSALILRINKLSGIPAILSNYKVAGLEDPEAIQFSGSTLYVTGRYALPGGNTNGSGFRFCFSRFDASSFAPLGNTKFYVTSAPSAGTARMYSTDILVSGNTAIMVGNGDDNNTADPFKNLNITKVNASTGAITWSRKYDNPAAASDGALTEIRLDNAGKYTVMGFALNSNTGSLDKAKLWSVNPSNGNLIWNKQYNLYRRTANNGSTYGYGFTIVGSYIYAVGQSSPGGNTKGALLKVNTANGNVSKADGTSCANSLNIQISPYTFYDSIPVTILTSNISSTNASKQVVKIKMNDSLACGTDVSNCCKLNLGIDGGSIANAHPKCGDTITGMQCTGHYYFSPVLACDSTNTNSAITSVSIKDAFNNIPSWAAGFNGTGNLIIPTGVSGVYTLSYSWGSNGAACDSCKYYLNITCCDASCKLSGTIRPPRSRIPQPYNCGDTAFASCNNSYDIIQSLKCNVDTSTHLVSMTLTDPLGGIPSWAAAFMANLGNGTLAIPTGINSGVYTLTYKWGTNGLLCDSCKMYLKITCCAGLYGTAGPDIAACCGGAQFNAVASGGIAPYTYSWTPSTGLSNANIANPICTLSGNYTVTIKDAYGCTITDQAVATIATGSGSCCRNTTAKESTITTITVSPNPTTNSFKIAGLKNETASLDIFNFQGVKVEHHQLVNDGNSFGARLPKGIYMLHFNFKDGTTQSLQLIKN